MAESNDGTGAGMDLFLEWAGRTGELNVHTAAALRGACRSVLAVDESGKSVDVTAVDAESLLDRWENLNRTKYSSGSLATYRSRFRQCVAMYRAWLLRDPAWRVAGKASSSKGTGGAARSGRPRKGGNAHPAVAVDTGKEQMHDAQATTAIRLVAYELPLRPELIVRLTLPVDLTSEDADRLSAFVRSLAFVAGPTCDDITAPPAPSAVGGANR